MKDPRPVTTRRRFLHTTALATAATALGPADANAAPDTKNKKSKSKNNAVPTFSTFAKPYQDLSYDDLADQIAELGFNGIEATVRKGGQVLPERVEDDLPKLVAALKKRDLEITAMATDINSVEPLSEKVLRTAADLGVPRYRMSYYRYDLAKSLEPQLESFKEPLADLVDLNRDLGIQAVYQNHSGAQYCGAALWDLYYLMREHDKKHLASAFDIGHALVEGGKCWSQHLALMLPKIELLYVKGPAYRDNKIEFGPLDESAHDAKKLFKMLAEGGFSGPYNLHVEYHMKSADKLANTLRDTPRDLATLKKWLAAA